MKRVFAAGTAKTLGQKAVAKSTARKVMNSAKPTVRRPTLRGGFSLVYLPSNPSIKLPNTERKAQ